MSQLKSLLRKILPSTRPRKLTIQDTAPLGFAALLCIVALVPSPFLWLLNATAEAPWLALVALLQHLFLLNGFAIYSLMVALNSPAPDRIWQFSTLLCVFHHSEHYGDFDLAYGCIGWVILLAGWTMLRMYKIVCLQILWEFCENSSNETKKTN